jgi:hypothetical protein
MTEVLLLSLKLSVAAIILAIGIDSTPKLAIACSTRHLGIAILVASALPGLRTAVIVAAYTLTSAAISMPYLRWRRVSATRSTLSGTSS